MEAVAFNFNSLNIFFLIYRSKNQKYIFKFRAHALFWRPIISVIRKTLILNQMTKPTHDSKAWNDEAEFQFRTFRGWT